MNNPKAIANQILRFLEMAAAICLLILLAGFIARAMHFGAVSQFLPSLDAMQLAYAGVCLWAIAGKARV